MKPGPIIAMVLLILLGMWMVLQPTLRRGTGDVEIRVGSMQIQLARILDPDPAATPAYQVVYPPEMAGTRIEADSLDEFLDSRLELWMARPQWERTLLGFFNITRWSTFGWVLIGLAGQAAFFGRMLVQWIISERTRVSTVPEIFWWFSFLGGLFLFTYFVWRKDVVGVLGQATGVVIYARNLRLIQKEHRRARAAAGMA